MIEAEKQDLPYRTIDASILIIDDEDDHAALIERCIAEIAEINAVVDHRGDLQGARAAIGLDSPDLILLDYRLKSENSLEFLRELRANGDNRPVVVLTSHGSEYVAVDMMRAGANNYIVKADLDPGILRDAIYPLIVSSKNNKELRVSSQLVIERLDSLTPREREVLDLIIQGQTNKQIAQLLSRSENTVKIHRSRVMQKMCARTPADLVRMVLEANSLAAILSSQNNAEAL